MMKNRLSAQTCKKQEFTNRKGSPALCVKCMFMYIKICIYMYMQIVYIYIYMCVYLYVHKYIYIYNISIYMYIYTESERARERESDSESEKARVWRRTKNQKKALFDCQCIQVSKSARLASCALGRRNRSMVTKLHKVSTNSMDG